MKENDTEPVFWTKEKEAEASFSLISVMIIWRIDK
jgi:hypothetical protein